VVIELVVSWRTKLNSGYVAESQIRYPLNQRSFEENPVLQSTIPRASLCFNGWRLRFGHCTLQSHQSLFPYFSQTSALGNWCLKGTKREDWLIVDRLKVFSLYDSWKVNRHIRMPGSLVRIENANQSKIAAIPPVDLPLTLARSKLIYMRVNWYYSKRIPKGRFDNHQCQSRSINL